MYRRSLLLQLPAILPFFMLVSVWLSNAQQSKVDFRELGKAATEELKETGTPGAAVAVVRGDQIVFAEGFGEANVETHEPVNPAMLFRLGAPTKMMNIDF